MIFLSVDCPLSQKYTRTLNELSKTFYPDVAFYGVFPDTTSPRKDYSQFQKKYEIPFELILDKGRKLTKALKAQITPECFVISKGEILYHGAIDDWVVGLGKTKSEPKINYLQNAISDVLSNTTPVIDYIKPIGCFID
ncbi:redoxin domain-containing protein [Niabella hibiscisoli]|nr:redoxin domain-containing protein [Niabella hibiscisoli]